MKISNNATLPPNSHLAHKMTKEVTFAQKWLSPLTCSILPSLYIHTDESTIQKRIKQAKAKAISIPVDDKVILNGYTCNSFSKTDKWVVYFPPNGTTAETLLSDANRLSKTLDVNVLVFNYRGVGGSTGFPSGSSDLVEDGAACFKYLKEKKKIPVSNIYAYGRSIGGGVAAELLASKEGKGAHLISDRSFSTLGDAIEKLPILSLLLIGKLARKIFEYKGWILNSVDNLPKIKGRILVVSTENDHMVGRCHLSDNIPNTLKSKVKLLKLKPTEANAHNLPLFANEPLFHNQVNTTMVFKKFIHGQ